jgi:predicted RNase H-like HicB family nuclease
MKRTYLVLIEKGDTNYGAYAPDVPGCGGIGDTPEEALQSLREGLQFHVEGLAESGDVIPEATYVAAEFVEVDIPVKVTAAS